MSYWQRGCDDAKAGRGPVLPMQCEPPDSVANMGYVNGYDYGKRQYLGSLVGQRIMARALAGSTAPDGVAPVVAPSTDDAKLDQRIMAAALAAGADEDDDGSFLCYRFQFPVLRAFVKAMLTTDGVPERLPAADQQGNGGVER